MLITQKKEGWREEKHGDRQGEKKNEGKKRYVCLFPLKASYGLLASPKGNLCCALLGSDQCFTAAQSLKEDTSEYSGGEHPWAAELLKHHKQEVNSKLGKVEEEGSCWISTSWVCPHLLAKCLSP